MHEGDPETGHLSNIITPILESVRGVRGSLELLTDYSKRRNITSKDRSLRSKAAKVTGDWINKRIARVSWLSYKQTVRHDFLRNPS
ncbi:Uncharacterized protein HZ326_9235 [Fusarium oxysporum f. sp. albedinis]|nr:Uncharacterized protein HZ326_9235 [Fusarium oxysporum f. sp. albedinis]